MTSVTMVCSQDKRIGLLSIKYYSIKDLFQLVDSILLLFKFNWMKVCLPFHLISSTSMVYVVSDF